MQVVKNGEKIEMTYDEVCYDLGFCPAVGFVDITPRGAVTFQNDTYYTIKIGEHIVQTGQIDMQDPFSWHEDLHTHITIGYMMLAHT